MLIIIFIIGLGLSLYFFGFWISLLFFTIISILCTWLHNSFIRTINKLELTLSGKKRDFLTDTIKILETTPIFIQGSYYESGNKKTVFVNMSEISSIEHRIEFGEIVSLNNGTIYSLDTFDISSYETAKKLLHNRRR